MSSDFDGGGAMPILEAHEVSVRFGDTCLLAVVRADRWATTTLPVLGTGRCLVGETRPKRFAEGAAIPVTPCSASPSRTRRATGCDGARRAMVG